MSASTPATPPAHALEKIINTIKCSLKSVIKRSHLEAAQWGNRKQRATASKSHKTTPKAAAAGVTLGAPFQNPEGPAALPLPRCSHTKPGELELSLGSQTHRQHVVSTSRQPLGQIKTISGSSSPFKWIYFFPGRGGQRDERGAGCSCCQQLEQTPAELQHFVFFFKLQCIRVHIPE